MKVVRINSPLLLLALLPVVLVVFAAFAVGGAILGPLLLLGRPRRPLGSQGPGLGAADGPSRPVVRPSAMPAIEAEFHRVETP